MRIPAVNRYELAVEPAGGEYRTTVFVTVLWEDLKSDPTTSFHGTLQIVYADLAPDERTDDQVIADAEVARLAAIAARAVEPPKPLTQCRFVYPHRTGEGYSNCLEQHGHSDHAVDDAVPCSDLHQPCATCGWGEP